MRRIIERFMDIRHWLVPYAVRSAREYMNRTDKIYPQHVYFSMVDHFEPDWKADYRKAVGLVKRWRREFAVIAARHKDCRGGPPKHNFFLPLEQYNPELTGIIGDLCRQGYGTVEFHLHHDEDTADHLEATLRHFKKVFNLDHQLLHHMPDTRAIGYAFIHGNWALDNSRSDGRWCGVNNEIEILKKTGCYADFTMPSGSGPTQTKTINAIYYAIDDPHNPKSHDFGIPMTIGVRPPADGLLMIQGPLALNWRDRKMGILPSIEDSDVSYTHPPTAERINLWIRERIRPLNDPQTIVVKVHTHGALPINTELLLSEYLDKIYSYLENHYNDGERYRLFYVSPFELYTILKSREELGVTNRPYRNQ